MSRNGRVLLKKKQSKADFLREWGMPVKYNWHNLRYKQPPIKGIYWYWFARFVRLRDYILWGKCISCGNTKSWEDMDAGHYAPAGNCGMGMIFDPRNANGECGRCNAWDEGHLIGYRRGLDERYGAGTAQLLDDRYFNRHKALMPEWSVEEYKKGIMQMRANAAALSTFLIENDLDGARAVVKSM